MAAWEPRTSEVHRSPIEIEAIETYGDGHCFHKHMPEALASRISQADLTSWSTRQTLQFTSRRKRRSASTARGRGCGAFLGCC